jgi:hypothetical protein
MGFSLEFEDLDTRRHMGFCDKHSIRRNHKNNSRKIGNDQIAAEIGVLIY